MKAWFGRLSLRYKLTLTALGVEALMLAFLIINGVQLTSEELQQQAEHRAHDMGKTLVAALLAPLSQQDDASVRDIVETVRHEGGLKMIEVRDSNMRIVHQAGSTAPKPISAWSSRSISPDSATAKSPSCYRAISSSRRVAGISGRACSLRRQPCC